jgi:hypothetical protein
MMIAIVIESLFQFSLSSGSEPQQTLKLNFKVFFIDEENQVQTLSNALKEMMRKELLIAQAERSKIQCWKNITLLY